MSRKAMDPDRFQMRDLKRRVKALEDQKDYMKADHRRLVGRMNLVQKILAQYGLEWHDHDGVTDQKRVK